MKILSYSLLIFVFLSTTGCSFYKEYEDKTHKINVLKANKEDAYEIYIFGKFDKRARFPNDLQVEFMVNRMQDPFSSGEDYLKLLDLNLNYPAILIFDNKGLVLATEKPEEAINFIKRRE